MKIQNLETGGTEEIGFMESRLPIGKGVLIKGNNKLVGKKFDAVLLSKRNQIGLGNMFGWNFIDLDKINVSLVEGEKEKSVIKRAIVGGVLTGGVGVIVGGLSGLGTKKTKQYLLEYGDMLFQFEDLKVNML